jgi:hypothetical protein
MTDTTTPTTADVRIKDEVLRWPDTTGGLGSRGEFSFRVGKREIGHLHGDRVAHLGFPKDVGARLHAEGRIGPHPVMPDNPAWGARAIRTADDERDVIALLRLNYDRITAH